MVSFWVKRYLNIDISVCIDGVRSDKRWSSWEVHTAVERNKKLGTGMIFKVGEGMIWLSLVLIDVGVEVSKLRVCWFVWKDVVCISRCWCSNWFHLFHRSADDKVVGFVFSDVEVEDNLEIFDTDRLGKTKNIGFFPRLDWLVYVTNLRWAEELYI